jgi:N-acetyl-1-D-myo-inositol-2-amino-2-deoxy-alpha-D-glucopyranoside deacetylase
MSDSVAFLAARPHPDDESSATGGLLAKYAAAGLRTAVITCTGGEEGEIHDPDLVYEEAFPRLAEIRERELRAACTVLGVAELRLLGYRDSGMAGTDANSHPEAFANVDLDEAAGRVAAIIRELRPRVVVTENEQGTYGHPDHVRCYKVTVRAWELASDPAAPVGGQPWQPARLYAMASISEGWEEIVELMREAGLDTAPLERMLQRRRERVPNVTAADVTAAIDVSDFAEVQRAALRCHRTQIPQDSFFMTLPPHILRRAFATAYLQRLHPRPSPADRDEDLFPSA